MNRALARTIRHTLAADIEFLRLRLARPAPDAERMAMKAALATVRETALFMELL